MPKFRDLSGIKFNKLLVIEFAGRSKSNRTMWKCLCDCGNYAVIRGEELTRGQKYCSNCVPKGRPSHGLSNIPEFGVWLAMKQRCDNPKCDAYNNYGARGITYCISWSRFENFFSDMGARPTKHHTLERKNNQGNYEPTNCCWATRKEQARNFRSNRILEYLEQKKCISEWGEIYGLKHDTISSRLERGWAIDRALTTPANKKYDHSKRRSKA